MAVNITISIPDEQIDRVAEAFNGLSERDIVMSLRDKHLNMDSSIPFNFLFDVSDKHSLSRIIKRVVVALIKLYELSKDNRRYRANIQSIEQPSEDVPNNIIEEVVE